MTKKKKKRDKEEYPDLNEKTNLKIRQPYMDNRYYVNGVKDSKSGKQVIDPLDDESKAFLNQFNREYYNASFRKEDRDIRLHVAQIDNETVQDIKGQIRYIKSRRKRIFDKSPNTTTDEDRELARQFTSQIEEMEEFLNEVFPRREREHANNARNRCFINRNRVSNEIDLVSWEDIDPESVWIESININYIEDEED